MFDQDIVRIADKANNKHPKDALKGAFCVKPRRLGHQKDLYVGTVTHSPEERRSRWFHIEFI